jgi:hypothetical protein
MLLLEWLTETEDGPNFVQNHAKPKNQRNELANMPIIFVIKEMEMKLTSKTFLTSMTPTVWGKNKHQKVENVVEHLKESCYIEQYMKLDTQWESILAHILMNKKMLTIINQCSRNSKMNKD